MAHILVTSCCLDLISHEIIGQTHMRTMTHVTRNSGFLKRQCEGPSRAHLSLSVSIALRARTHTRTHTNQQAEKPKSVKIRNLFIIGNNRVEDLEFSSGHATT